MKEKSKATSGEQQTDPTSYVDAVTELESILAEIESGDADVDLLSVKVKRALFLVGFCRNRLRQTDEEVRKLIQGMDEE
ncbi:MAG: exodeoxyribonuclease VII small subunit [Bacteroidota bacterium]|jgi:exodeoxyribonuclease VII small subunit